MFYLLFFIQTFSFVIVIKISDTTCGMLFLLLISTCLGPKLIESENNIKSKGKSMLVFYLLILLSSSFGSLAGVFVFSTIVN